MTDAEIVRWLASTTGITAALVVALNLGRIATGSGFCVFTVSSSAWIVAGLTDGLPSLVTQNAVLTAINVLGVYRWLVRKGPR